MLNTIKTKYFAAILSTALLISGISTIPVYAKGLSKAVKKEYTKILKRYIVPDDDPTGPYFKIADINNDGEKDLILQILANTHFSEDLIYFNRKNREIIKVKGEFLAGWGIKSYKNYMMAIGGGSEHGHSYYNETIYKTDKNGNFKPVYTLDHSWEGLEEDDIVESISYVKFVNGKEKKISKKEYNNFASKFKEVKGELHKVSKNNIKKYVK